MIHYCLHTTKKLIKWFKTQRSDNFHAYLPFSHTGSFHDLLYGPNIKFTITLLMWRKVEFRRCVLKFKERRFTGFLSVYDDCVKMFLCRYLHNYHWCLGEESRCLHLYILLTVARLQQERSHFAFQCWGRKYCRLWFWCVWKVRSGPLLRCPRSRCSRCPAARPRRRWCWSSCRWCQPGRCGAEHYSSRCRT